MSRDIEWEAEQYLLGRCAKCAEREKALQQARAEQEESWRKWASDTFDCYGTTAEEIRTELLERDKMVRADYGYLRKTVMPKEVAQARQATWKAAILVVDTATVFRHGRSEYIEIVETVQRMNAEFEAAAQAQGVEAKEK